MEKKPAEPTLFGGAGVLVLFRKLSSQVIHIGAASRHFYLNFRLHLGFWRGKKFQFSFIATTKNEPIQGKDHS